MAFTIACIQNSEAIEFLSMGKLDDAVAGLKGALSSVKKVVDSTEDTVGCAVMNVDAASEVTNTLFARNIDFEGLNDEHHIVCMFHKAFALADNSEQQDENLLAAILLYNIGLAYSLQRRECSDASRVFKLYRLSLQILLDSGVMCHPTTNLLLMALYNNIAHLAFCVHEIEYAINAIRELMLVLMDDSVKANLSCNKEDSAFFHQNTFVLASDMSIATSPAA